MKQLIKQAKKKICFIVADYKEPWAEAIKNNAHSLINNLSKKYDVFVIGPSDTDKENYVDGIKIHYVKSPLYLTRLKRLFYPIGILKLISKSKKIIEKEEPDLIITSLESPSVGFVGSSLRKFSKKQIKFIQIVNAEPYSSNKSPLKYWIIDELPHLLFNNKFFFRKGMEKADINITITKNLLRIANDLGLSNCKYIPYGVDIEKFKKIKRSKNSEFTIGYLGHLIYAKGAGLLLEAFNDLSKKYNFRLQLATTWGSEEKILQEYDTKKIDNFGILKDQNSFYNSCDLLILPLRFSFATLSMPQIILESQASGTLVLASNLNNIKEIIKSDKTGYLFKANNKSALSSNIIKIYKNQKKMEKITKSARKNIEKNYDLKKTCKEFENLIINMIK